MPSILKNSERKVLRYFNKYGFNNVELTLLIMEPSNNWLEVLELEQYFLNYLMPNLNVDFIAGGYFGYHSPMSEEAINKLREERGTKIYIYDNITHSLIFIAKSKQQLYDIIGIHHTSLKSSLENGNLYLDRFFFSAVRPRFNRWN